MVIFIIASLWPSLQINCWFHHPLYILISFAIFVFYIFIVLLRYFSLDALDNVVFWEIIDLMLSSWLLLAKYQLQFEAIGKA